MFDSTTCLVFKANTRGNKILNIKLLISMEAMEVRGENIEDVC